MTPVLVHITTADDFGEFLRQLEREVARPETETLERIIEERISANATRAALLAWLATDQASAVMRYRSDTCAQLITYCTLCNGQQLLSVVVLVANAFIEAFREEAE